MAADEAFGNPQIPPIELDSISAYMLEPPLASLFDARSPDHLARRPLGYGQRGVVWAVLPLLWFARWESLWLQDPTLGAGAKTPVSRRLMSTWIDITMDRVHEQLDDSTTSLHEVFQERRVRGQPPSVVDVDCEAKQYRDEPISPTGSRTPRSSSPGSQHPTLDVHMPQPDAEDTTGQTSVITEHLEDRVNEYMVQTRDACDEHGIKPTTESFTGQRGRAKSLRTSKSMTSMTEVMSAQALAPAPTGHSMPWGNNPNYPGWAFPPRLEPMTGPSMTHAELMEQEDVRQRWMRTYQAQMSGVSNPGPTPQASIPRQPPSLASKANLPDASAEATAAPPPTAAKTKGTPGATVPSRKRKASPPGALNVPGMSDELEPEHKVPREQVVSTPHASSKRAVRSSSRVSQKTIGSKSGSEVPQRGKSSSTSRSQSGAELENVRDTGKKPCTTAAQRKQPVKAPFNCYKESDQWNVLDSCGSLIIGGASAWSDAAIARYKGASTWTDLLRILLNQCLQEFLHLKERVLAGAPPRNESPVLKTFASAANATVILIHVTPNETGASCAFRMMRAMIQSPIHSSILSAPGYPRDTIGPRFDALPSNMRLVLFEESKHINDLQELAALVRMHEGLSPPKVLNS
ncbi:hypothetical protein BDV93DRAFT_514980 [Ceratobasidium sp. AG-I]|nr:hypothetical protein BDV93DRAFT_514980 [Ceratobasidium sp. AG-I]